MNQEAVREFLLQHSRSDKNGQFPETFEFSKKITNPLCGDHVELRIHSDGMTIFDIGYKARACAICTASASVLSENVRGKDVSSALQWAESFEEAVIKEVNAEWPSEISHLASFEHLRVSPSRKMCGLLPWIVLKSTLRNQS